MSRRKQPRRKHARAEVDWPVTVAGGKATMQGRIKNISRSGALLYLAEELDLHEHIRLAIEIPEFEDVISAKGEVIRTSSVITDQNVTSFSMAVKFTEITNEDLRYFTGNLAPEWQEGREESSLAPTRRSSVKSILYGLAVFFLISVTFYALRLGDDNQLERDQILELGKRISVLEEKLTVSKTIESSGTNLENQVKEIQDQLVTMQSKITTFATVEKLQYQNRYFEEKIEKIYHSVTPSSKETKIIFSPGDKKQLDFLYHSVQRGDNLYRISIKYGINVNKIKELNNIPQNESIRPGQKLIVGWK